MLRVASYIYKLTVAIILIAIQATIITRDLKITHLRHYSITENKGMAWSQLLESTSHLWGAKRLVLCNSEPYMYIERKAIQLAIDNNHNNYRYLLQLHPCT